MNSRTISLTCLIISFRCLFTSFRDACFLTRVCRQASSFGGGWECWRGGGGVLCNQRRAGEVSAAVQTRQQEVQAICCRPQQSRAASSEDGGDDSVLMNCARSKRDTMHTERKQLSPSKMRIKNFFLNYRHFWFCVRFQVAIQVGKMWAGGSRLFFFFLTSLTLHPSPPCRGFWCLWRRKARSLPSTIISPCSVSLHESLHVLEL